RLIAIAGRPGSDTISPPRSWKHNRTLLDGGGAMRIQSKLAALTLIVLTHHAIAQNAQPELTPAGKAFLQKSLAAAKPPTFPLPTCMFHGGLCGAARRDGSVAVPPGYDWVGTFADGRAAFRLNGLYGFVDEDGNEIV